MRDERKTKARLIAELQALRQRLDHRSSHPDSTKIADALMDSPLQAVILLNAQGVVQYVNQLAARNFGQPPEDLVGRRMADLLPPDIGRQRRTQALKVLKTGRSMHFEDRAAGRFYEHYLEPIVDDQRRVELLLVCSRDITERRTAEDALRRAKDDFEHRLHRRTKELVDINKRLQNEINERKRTEAALRESENRFSSFMDNMPAMAFMKDADGRYIYINRWYEKAFGVRWEDRVGKTDFEVFPPEYAEAVTEQDRKVRSQNRPGAAVESLPYLGEIRSQLTYKFPVTRRDGAAILGGVAVDITDLKRTEAALQESFETLVTVLDSTDADIYVADLETYEVLFANKHKLDTFGARDPVGKPCWEVFRNSCGPCSHCNNDRLLDEEGNPTGVHVWEGRNSVTDRWYINHDRAIRWLDGRWVRLQVATDITDRLKMEEELVKAQKLESLGILAGGIAHDFNNILTAVIGNLILARTDLEKNTETEEAVALLEEAERAAGNAKHLTRQLLTFSKGGSPIKEKSSIAQLIRDSATFALRGSKARCAFQIPDSLWPAAVDKGQMDQVIHNLIVNADQAMPEGGIIHVGAENVSIGARHDPPLEPGRYVRIAITDSGIGIPPEDLAKIFDPYFTTKPQGTGLGLSTVYSIVNKHEGHVDVSSRPGAGTTFYVYIPAADGDARVDSREHPRSPSHGNGSVLVMDDEEAVRTVTGKLLEELGYRVRVAKEGREAVEAYKESLSAGTPPAAVILDLTIPGGMGGKKTVHKLLEIDPGVKAIACSGYSNDPVMANCGQWGFCAVLAKPFTPRELAEVLDKATGT
jgi:PAS domain S-box-containing protein